MYLMWPIHLPTHARHTLLFVTMAFMKGNKWGLKRGQIRSDLAPKKTTLFKRNNQVSKKHKINTKLPTFTLRPNLGL